MTLTHEWEAPGFIAPSSNSIYEAGTVHGVTHFEATADPIYYDRTHSASVYLPETHWVRLTARLQEYETRDETVVFHNLTLIKTRQRNKYLVNSQAQSQITPDGVTVTLADPRPDKDAHNRNSLEATAVMIRLTSAVAGSLPKSPLEQRLKGVVILSCYIPPPLTGFGSSGGTYMFYSDKPWPKVIANFPVIIRQRVNLRAVPMTFVLPVGK